ncbi:AMP-binding protein [Oryctes borbonicus]|uniref:AMP-binding protein n=1 Tax=Oryctes borbonicus TaxID=1629725 RepID=A0A0T6B7G2_9SCAR|nr:AMP-binding protein [Oryctes borbonicus]
MSLVIKYFSNNQRLLCAPFVRYKYKLSANNTNNGDHIKSMIPDIKVPKAHFVEYVMKDFGKWHNKIAIECSITQKKYTFEEMRQNSINLGKSLRKIFQLKKGNTIGIFLPNNPDYPICVFGIMLAALTVTTINPSCTVGECMYVVKIMRSQERRCYCMLETACLKIFSNCFHYYE